jgi:adenosylmethionine-8-amino-7-oxononanoate aminotransferase
MLNNIEQIKKVLCEGWFTNHNDIAGFIFEPLVQGAAGNVDVRSEVFR